MNYALGMAKPQMTNYEVRLMQGRMVYHNAYLNIHFLFLVFGGAL
jgi:hypothetical protein